MNLLYLYKKFLGNLEKLFTVHGCSCLLTRSKIPTLFESYATTSLSMSLVMASGVPAPSKMGRHQSILFSSFMSTMKKNLECASARVKSLESELKWAAVTILS